MNGDRHIVGLLSGTDRDESLIRYAAMVARLNAGARQPDVDAVTAGRTSAADVTAPASGGLDGFESDGAAWASKEGQAILLTAPAEVRFIHVLEQASAGSAQPDPEATRLRLLAQVHAHFRDGPEVLPARMDVLEGPPINRLKEATATAGADGLLIGEASERWLAERLMRDAAYSVWWVPERAPPRIGRILVPVDFSTRAADGLRVATALARLSGAAECLALHVYFNDSPLADERQDRVLREQLAELFARFVAGIDCLGVTIKPLFREGANAAWTIARTAEEERADLIVMASRGRTLIGALLMESIAAQTLRETSVPLLVVKHFGARLGLWQVVRERLLHRPHDVRFN